MADLGPEQVLVTKIANVALDLDSSLDIAAITRKVSWVGGKISLFREHLMFAPHRVEAALLPPDAIKEFGVEIASIKSLTVESRLGVKTILIRLENVDTAVGIRCLGATQFAETVRSFVTESRERETTADSDTSTD